VSRRTIALFWLVLSATWAVVIFATDQLAWPLALWIATTVGPLTRWASKKSKSVDESKRCV